MSRSSRSTLRVVHIDGERTRWAGGQNQVRLLLRELAGRPDMDQLCLCPSGSPLEQRLRDEGLPVRGIAWKRGTDLKALRAIARYTRDADIIHTHDAHSLQLSILPALLRKHPIVAARRSNLRTRALKWNRATRVVAISNTVETLLLASGVRPDRIRVIPSGIDPAEVAALPLLEPSLRARLGSEPDAFLAGNVATLLEYKQQTLIPEAAAQVPDASWAIVGEGPWRGAIERAIDDHGVGARVHLTGNVPDARRCLRELDLFVFTSRGEALGTSVLDAMAAGVPVIAAEDAGPAEVLRPVHAATASSLYPVGDAAALAALVRRLRADPAQRARMVTLQSERLRDYEVAHTAELTLGLYREVVQEA
jgi:glycosyltransferase involved in cell wall biosynthesis